MSGSISEDSGSGRLTDSMSSSQRCPSDESLPDYRSCDQNLNGVASTTSPAFWDTDDDDDCGPKPSELFGKFTWKIENFSQISKRELRSNAFEVGGYKWYILVYPQGCDVCNHLSLFLCVANHEKLLPGWSHFAQFTIAVVNKDPKKSKYSDTLHRFWKKEHDWGWKKFMELSKIYDGFVVSDMLVIKAQVQVIREKVYRPFRCLDCVYRRELIRVYLTNVEGICRRFIEERRSRLGKLIEDKARWASFRTFWVGVDQTGRRSMSNEKCDSILKVVVKHFFIEKEVTSTLVMDSLYSGLRALECQSSNKKLKDKAAEVEDIPPPIVRVEKDTFVLADDVLQLLEKAACEPLPPSKDDKGPQNRTKEGTSGEDFNKDSVERDEKRLTELGRRTVEIFVVTHIFSNRIEVAYQEAVALKRQEELIREEEAAVLAETDQKSKRGAAEKDKRKKKQAKQKKNKKKEKGRDDKSTLQKDKHLKHRFLDDPSLDEPPMKDDLFAEKGDDQEGDISDVSDTGEDMSENLQPDVEERDAGPINWDTDASEVHPAPEASGPEVMNGDTAINERAIRKNQSAMDDSSSTCSNDSAPSVVMNGGADKGLSIQSNQTSPSRGRNNQEKENQEQNSCHEADALSVGASSDTNISYDTETGNQDTRVEVDPVSPSKNEPQWVEQRPAEKETEISSPIRKLTIKDVTQPDRTLKPPGDTPAEASSSPSSSQPAIKKGKSATTREENGSLTLEAVPSSPASVSSPSEKTFSLLTRSPRTPPLTPHVEPQRPRTAGRASGVRLDHSQSMRSTLMETDSCAPLSRPSSAPIVSVPRPSSAVISSVHSSPVHSSSPSLGRSISATGRLGINADQPIASSSGSASSSYVVHNQSYRNAMMNSRGRSSSSPSYSSVSHSIPNVVPTYPPPVPSTLPLYSPPSPALSQNSVMDGGCSVGRIECPGFTFGTVTPEILPQPQSESLQEETTSLLWINECLQQDARSGLLLEPYQRRDTVRADFIPSGRRAAAGVGEEDFPHLDIINYLFDEEQNQDRDASMNGLPHNIGHHHLLNGAGQYAYQGMISNRLEEVGMLELAASSSCRYERSLMYSDDGFQHIYGGASSTNPYEILRDGQDASSIMPYALQHNGQTSGMFSPSNRSGHRQWSAGSSSDNVSLLRNSESDPSLYLMMPSDYSEMVNGGRLNGGYSVYGPANGH